MQIDKSFADLEMLSARDELAFRLAVAGLAVNRVLSLIAAMRDLSDQIPVDASIDIDRLAKLAEKLDDEITKLNG